ncbi:hypothetical protein AB4Z54_15475 [Streptomyces sp. MCAF7]
MTTTTRLAKLREKSETSERQAEKDKAALLAAAVEEAMTSTRYGHLSAVAKDAGIASQYLRDLIEKQHPGWLAEAAAERKAAKETASRKSGKAAA